jgi:glycosyltransferase involved in cell wall biosynthesis
MRSRPTLSVLIPAHNTDAYLGDTLHSALTQTYANLEVLVLDDGSTDRTREIATRWASRDPRIRVLVSDRAFGAAAGRNRAAAIARGRYLALLDSDDLWLPQFVERQLEAFEAYPDVAVVSGNLFNLGGPWHGQPYRPMTAEPTHVTFLEMIERESAICISSVFRREVYEAIGGFDEIFRRNEDYEFWLRAAAAGFKFLQTPEPLGWYRRRPDSVSADEPKMIQGVLTVYQKTRALCRDGSREQRALDVQIARFERELLKLTAKTSLRAGAYARAADEFQALAARDPRLSTKLLAAVSQCAPRMLYRFDRWRTSIRQLRKLSSAPQKS